MDSPSSGDIAVDDEELRDRPRITIIPAAELVRFARSGTEDRVFAAFARLAEGDPRVICLGCEYLQVKLINGEPHGSSKNWSSVRELNFFRLTQRIRDEHGTKRKNPHPNCFQSFEDIVELERSNENDNCVEFMIQCLRLDLVDLQHVHQMLESTFTVEQLAALYDESVSFLDRYDCSPYRDIERSGLALKFQSQFANLTRSRPCWRPLWRDIKVYLERAVALETTVRLPSDEEIPDEDLDEALSCLLSNAQLFRPFGRTNELLHLSECLLSRGASLYRRDQHGVPSLTKLLDLGLPQAREWLLRTLSTYICCPLKDERGKIVVGDRRPAPLSCLAARRIPFSAFNGRLPSKLLSFARYHLELREALEGCTPSPDDSEEYDLYYGYDG